jgi:hypothetical protein
LGGCCYCGLGLKHAGAPWLARRSCRG